MEFLAQQLARGDRDAFAALYDACAEGLLAYLCHKLPSRDEAADVVQEVFACLARSRKSLAKVQDMHAYVFIVARNEAVRYNARRAQRRQKSLETLAGREQPMCTRDLEDQETSERRESIARAIASLDVPLREIVELKIYGELTLAQIAYTLDLPPGTVATRYRKALTRLHDLLAGELR